MKRIVIEISKEQLLCNGDEIIIRMKVPPSEERHEFSFSDYIQKQIHNWEEKKHYRTAATYKSARNSFMAFRNGQDIHLSQIDKNVIENYEKYLLTKGITKNSTSFYMRILRAVYNRAVADGIIEDNHPFRTVYTGIGKTDKRAIGIDAIRAIQNYQTRNQSLAFARDMFMFSFYTLGMSFVDMAYLERADITGGYLTYRRKKTGALLKIKWEPQMQAIIDRQQTFTTRYLLPILKSDKESQAKRNIHACQRKINRNLKRIAKDCKIDVNLTMYVARHSWASIARKMLIPISVISDGMGHSSERTTRIYLKTFDTTHIDKANQRIITTLHKSSKK